MAKELETITEDGEIITSTATVEQMSLAIGLSRAEIDQQISTAHAYPRAISRATKNILSLVTIDEEAAAECNYALPRGGKAITGPSIRLAEIVAGQWGNCRVGARVVHVDRAEKYVEAEGVFHDLETNAATTARVRRRIVDSKGRLFNDDMIIMTGNAACSIAKRNAILGGVPKAVWRKAHDAALATVKGDIKTLTERRDRVMTAFAAFGIKPEQVLAAVGLSGMDDVMIEHLPILVGMHASLKSGEATVEEMFGGGKSSDGGEKKDLKGKMQDFADGGKDKGKPSSKGDAGVQEASGKKAKNSDADAKPKDAEAKKSEAKSEKSDPAENAASNDDAADGAASEGEKGDHPELDPPTEDDFELARDRGHDAYHKGMSRKGVPEEYTREGREKERDLWLGAYDAAKNEDGGND
ncbi:hypothetical protein LJR231_001812 [Phyllobacterium sp. LjRoot231]|uniref:hypothetical protein n=1 Tax=Phyllobacterium sp. LjRoot231 TaxID=3342289 RepID=UPI003ECDB923